jgi:hypothetical protein
MLDALSKKILKFDVVNQIGVAGQTLAFLIASLFSICEKEHVFAAVIMALCGLVITPLLSWFAIPRKVEIYGFQRSTLVLQSCCGTSLQLFFGSFLFLVLFREQFSLDGGWYILPIILGVLTGILYINLLLQKR